MKRDDLIVVRGGGDLATGVVHRLWSAGLRVLVLETAHPPPSVGRCLSVRLFTKARPLWKECGASGWRRWRMPMPSGHRTQCRF